MVLLSSIYFALHHLNFLLLNLIATGKALIKMDKSYFFFSNSTSTITLISSAIF